MEGRYQAKYEGQQEARRRVMEHHQNYSLLIVIKYILRRRRLRMMRPYHIRRVAVASLRLLAASKMILIASWERSTGWEKIDSFHHIAICVYL